MWDQSLVKLCKGIKSIIKDVRYWFKEKLNRILQTRMKLMISLKEQLTFSNECLASIKKNQKRKSNKKLNLFNKMKPNQMMKFLSRILLKRKSQELTLLELIKETLRFTKFKNQRQVFTLSSINFPKRQSDKIKFFDRKTMILTMKLMKV